MLRIAAGVLLAVLASAGMAQQQPAFRDPHPARSTPTDKMDGRTFGDPNQGRKRQYSADEQQCRRLERQILRAEERVREAKTTGEQNQLAAKRQELVEQRSRAGC